MREALAMACPLEPMHRRHALSLAPISIRRAVHWVGRTHRRLPVVLGGLWAIGAFRDEELVGCAIVGWPARILAERGILAVLRVAVAEGQPNACSMLYGACSRAARAMGATGLVTYTHQDEPGTSLRASGWIEAGLTEGRDWDRPSRPRQLALFPEPKRRWWAAWSKGMGSS